MQLSAFFVALVLGATSFARPIGVTPPDLASSAFITDFTDSLSPTAVSLSMIASASPSLAASDSASSLNSSTSASPTSVSNDTSVAASAVASVSLAADATSIDSSATATATTNATLSADDSASTTTASSAASTAAATASATAGSFTVPSNIPSACFANPPAFPSALSANVSASSASVTTQNASALPTDASSVLTSAVAASTDGSNSTLSTGNSTDSASLASATSTAVSTIATDSDSSLAATSTTDSAAPTPTDSDTSDPTSADATLDRRIAQTDLPDMAQSWQDICLVSGGDIFTNEPCVQLAGVDGINALLADADPCAQQDNADAMIDFAKSPGVANAAELIANAIAYRQHPRNAINMDGIVPSTPYCQRPPRNEELAGFVNDQLPGVNPGIFGGPSFGMVAFGDPSSCPYGMTPEPSNCGCAPIN